MTKWLKSSYIPKNPNKCINSREGKEIVCRSSWERRVCQHFDAHPSILEWGSEIAAIPYYHPFKKRMGLYIPDFIVRYTDKNGKIQTEVLEVKPAKEAILEKAKSRYDKFFLAVNYAKWGSAIKWCNGIGAKFRVLTEEQLFSGRR